MKYNIFAIAIVSLIVFSLFTPSQTYAAAADDAVKIEDPVLEKAIRDELKLEASAPLDAKALEKLTSLYPKGKEKIKSLKGLNKAIKLKELYLPNQEITDISPLSSLYNLTFLSLSGNRIQNVCPTLPTIYQLKTLLISDNQIEDVSCLSHLSELTDLLASNNRITNIAPLAKLHIGWLDVSKNPLGDITPLSSMSTLHNIYLNKDSLDEKSKDLLQRFEQSGVAVNRTSPITDSVSGISVLVNDERVLFEHSPIVDAGTTLVQFRPLFEKLGFTIEWDQETRTIHAKKQGITMTLQVDSTNGSLNGSPHTLTVAPRNVEGSVFVPIRFVGEASNYVVTWDSKAKTIYLMPTRSVVTPDSQSKFTVSGKWLNKRVSTSLGYQTYMTHDNVALLTFTESKLDAVDFKTLGEYSAAIKKSLESIAISFSDDKIVKINGLDARQFSYSVKNKNGITYRYLQTLMDGSYNYYRVVLQSEKLIDPEVGQDYQSIVQTFQEIKTPAQLSEEKFRVLTPTDRFLDAAHYYRNFGYFNKDKALSSQEFDNKYLGIYNKSTDWNPFDSSKFYNEFAELYMLELDQERVWLEDTEADVAKGNDVYVDTLKWWSYISRGAFEPTEIMETWGTDGGPVTITFTMFGQKKVLHPEYFYDYIDVSILREINEMIKDSGYEFVAVSIDQDVFVTVLKADEKRKLEQERYIAFINFK